MTLCLLLPDRVQAQAPPRYPNELAGFRFFESAPWRTLVPLSSTMADVRKVLGDPQEAIDLAHYNSYPGDATAEAPLFIYQFDKAWKVYIYFAGPKLYPANGLSKTVFGRLFSIDLISEEPLHFLKKLPKPFVRKPTLAADAGWDEFRDCSGLCYSVYTSSTPYGKTKPGDLNRISYGPSDAEIARNAKRK